MRNMDGHIWYPLDKSENNSKLRAPGITPIVTADPENIKAILATQFQDFGKGQEFHDGWKFVLLLTY